MNEVRNDPDNQFDSTSFTTQLAGKAQQTDMANVLKEIQLRKSLTYGAITLPSDFYPVDFKLTRDRFGKVQHDIDLDKRWRNNAIQVTIYVNTDTGNNSTGNGSSGTPYRTPKKAFDVINADVTNTRFKVVIDGTKILRGEFAGEGTFVNFASKFVIVTTVSNKIIPVVEAQDSSRASYDAGGTQFGALLAWTLNSGTVYSTTRSSTGYVLDLTNRDKTYNTIIPMIIATSIADCESKPHSYFISGSTVYVHTFDNRVPDGNIEVVLSTSCLDMRMTNSTFFVENLEFYGVLGFQVRGDINSTFINNSCKYGLSIGANSNGLNVNDIGKNYTFGCISHDTQRDGFNYHFVGIATAQQRNCLVFEYDNVAFNNGINDTNLTNNAFTCHEGVCILRVNDFGFNTKGTVCADVNGCYSVLVDCKMNGSILNTTDWQACSYYFFADTNVLGGKVVLINCSGRSPFATLETDGSGMTVTLSQYYEGLSSVSHTGTLIIA
jgi:hypothetical protein